MDQFVHLPEFQVIICNKCQYAVLPSEVDSHFTKSPIHDLSKASRRSIQERVARVEGLIKNKEMLAKRFIYPPPTAPAIPGLGPPKTDGLWCMFEDSGERCQYVSRHEQLMRQHCRDIHQWANVKKVGRPRKGVQNKESPWQEGIHCQRFFTHGIHSNYFPVRNDQVPTPNAESPEYKARKEIQSRIDKARELVRRKIEIADKAQEPSPWLRRVRWDHHLQGKDRDKLRELIQPVDPEEEELSIIHSSFDRIMDECQKHIVEEVVGEAALFTVNATEYGKKGDNPFYMDMKENTHSKYRSYWKQMLSFVVRGELEWSPEDRPHYQFTRGQKTAFAKLISKAEAFRGIEIGEEMDEAAKQQMTELDKQCLQFCIELLDHRLVRNPYDNAIISGLSILGIKDSGEWVQAIEYTTIYSAIIKVARALVIEQAHQKWCRSIAASKILGMDEDEAIELNQSQYQLVKAMVDKFMGLAGGRRDPSPMDWIVSKRTYGMKIRSTTAADGEISWIGDKILGYELEFNMGQLQTTIHSVVANARMILMRDLMMVPLDAIEDVNEGQVPPINWASLRDNMGESKIGWSFLDDIRNPFSVDGPWWLFQRVFHEPKLKSQFVQSIEPMQWRQRAMKQYERHLVHFQELLLFCCHFTGGQPSRAPEILSIRHRNTANGGIRNVGVENGLMFYVPKTHKNFMQTGNTKIVHHWLPQEVSELLLYYLWLVLPFWERVQISVDEDVKLSPFIWGKPALEMEKPDEKDEKQPGGWEPSEIDNPEPQDDIIKTIDNEVYVKAGPWHKEWTSSRLRGIIRRECVKGMNVKMNINAWRNIVEAISQKFLRHPFEFDEDEEWKDEGDEIWEEQFGHSAPMGEQMYGRLLTEAPDERGSRRAKFRVISQEWHRFLNFPSASHNKMKVARSFYDEAMHQMQIRRRQYIGNTNVQRELEAYMGEGTQFRGEQKRAITAIMQGKSPLLIVMGTGSGKSLLFMLPAFCVQGGTSIVVVPLQSLQADLKGRCDKDGITCVIWRAGQAIEPVSIVLVTPESALTKGFRDFINLLRATHRLDRVFIDECHSVSASSATFRPTMRHLGELVSIGTQVVFLTATLRPRSEGQFCKSMNIIGRGVVKVREPTTRKNIRYQIRTYQPVQQKGSNNDSMIAAVVQVVEELKIKYPAPAKIIVYSRRITQAEKLSKTLGCMLYHAKVDDRDGKDERLKKWQSGEEESRVAVATNAMGLGINTGDTRGVVHAGMPKDLADYAQESGRGGRDGLPSEAIVVLPAEEEPAAKVRRGINSRIAQQARPGKAIVYYHKKDRPATQEENEMTAEVERFVHGSCRRIAIDQAMDGNFERSRCMEDEEACDLCNRHQGCHQRAQDDLLSALEDDTAQDQAEMSPQDDVTQQARQGEITFRQQDSERGWVEFHIREREKQEAHEVEQLEQQLDRFNGQCAYCYVHSIPSTTHSIDQCTIQGAKVIRQGVEEFVRHVQDKKSFEQFSCCLYCYVPQAICQRWKHKEKDGRWEEDSSKDCQYKNVIIPAFWSMVTFGGEQEMEWLCQWAKEDGYNIRDPNQEAWWLGKKVEWGGIKGNNLIRAFGIIAGSVNREEE